MIKRKINNIDFLTEKVTFGSTLDFGSGKGALVKAMKRLGKSVVGCDILPWYHTKIGQEIDGVIIGKDLILSGISELPFSDKEFDQIISNQVIEHIENSEHIFSELNRVLKKGGKAHLLFPTYEMLIEPHTRIPFLHKFKFGGIIFNCLVLSKYVLSKRTFSGVKRHIKETNSYFKSSIHFKRMSELRYICEKNNFKFIDKSDQWLNDRFNFSFPINYFTNLIHPKLWIGCYVVLEKL